MMHRFSAVAALAFYLAVAGFDRDCAAQNVGRMAQPGTRPATPRVVPEELPRGQFSPGYHAGQGTPPIVEEGALPYGHCSDGSCPDAYSGGGYYPTYEGACCDTCGGYGDGCCGWAEGCCSLWSGCGPAGQIYIIADYLNVRASFSEALSHIQRDIVQSPQTVSDRFEQLDFEYDSSYRFGGGWRMQNCGEEVRFLYTRLTSFADRFAPDGSLLPFDPAALDDEQATIHSFVDVDSFDLEYRKTIPLGGPLAAGCGEACGDDGYCGDGGCGKACGCGCPAWDITWSAGARFAEVDWTRAYFVSDGTNLVRETRSSLNFEGGGPRVGLEGRRYYGQGGWFSMYLKGDISLLLGDFDLVTLQRQEDGNGPGDDIFLAQSIRNRILVPVTELEAGLTANITCNSTITTGYLFSAWHDLGFRDEFAFVPSLETHYDDANILGFDGFFARVELAY